MESDDPTSIRVLAVTADDVVTALETNQRRDTAAVLRVTPPFSGRMRARLHLDGTEHDYDDPEPIHVPPERLVGSIPSFPTADDTADELRSDPETTYSAETHRSRHEGAIEEWRRHVRESLLETATLPTAAGPHRVRITTLG